MLLISLFLRSTLFTLLLVRSRLLTVLFWIWAPVIRPAATAVPVSDSRSASDAMTAVGLGKRTS